MKIQKKGFTLIELLVVISIISLLSAIGLSAVSSARLKGRDARRFQDLSQIRSALNLYFDNHNYYPVMATDICGTWRRSDAVAPSACWSEFGTSLSQWLPVMPKDPRNLTTTDSPPVAFIYAYSTVNDGAGYRLATVLETNTALGDGCLEGVTKPTNFPDSYYCIGENFR